MNVTIYSTTTCPYCKMAKDFFDEQGIKYKDVDVSTNQKAINEMVEKSGQMGVPVIIMNKNKEEKIIVGFDQKTIEKFLKK